MNGMVVHHVDGILVGVPFLASFLPGALSILQPVKLQRIEYLVAAMNPGLEPDNAGQWPHNNWHHCANVGAYSQITLLSNKP